VALAGPEPGVLKGVSVAEVKDGRLRRRLDAEEARWEEGGWTLKGVVERSFRPDGSFAVDRRQSMPYPLAEGPEDFRFEKLKPEEVSCESSASAWERYRAPRTRNARVGGRAVDEDQPALRERDHGFAGLSLRRGRRAPGGTSFGIVLAVGLGFAYWMVLAAGLSLGKSGSLPALWLPGAETFCSRASHRAPVAGRRKG